MATETTGTETKTTEGGNATGETKPDAKATDARVEAKDVKVADDIALKFPEGFKADEALLGKVKPLFKELGLKSEQAQKLADTFAAHQLELSKSAEKESEKAFADLKAGYLKDLKADKDLGGAKFDATIAAAKKALTKFGTPELTKLLDDTGFGNHPELVRFVARVGGALAEDSVAGAKGNGSSATDPNEHLWNLYPSMRPKSA